MRNFLSIFEKVYTIIFVLLFLLFRFPKLRIVQIIHGIGGVKFILLLIFGLTFLYLSLAIRVDGYLKEKYTKKRLSNMFLFFSIVLFLSLIMITFHYLNTEEIRELLE